MSVREQLVAHFVTVHQQAKKTDTHMVGMALNIVLMVESELEQMG